MSNQEYIKKDSTNNTVILLIHGFLGKPEHFEKFIPAIPDEYAIYNIILDGHGKNLSDFSRSSMKKWKKQIESILAELTIHYKQILIVAHSMGTLFALDAAIKYKTHIKSIFLLAVPLRVQLSFSAIKNALKVVFNRYEDDEIALAFKNSCGVSLTYNPIDYIRCIPRYLELFTESRRIRKSITDVNVPVFSFQSAKDELVSRKSEKYIKKNDKIILSVLEKSRHFLYNKEDMEYLLENFRNLL